MRTIADENYLKETCILGLDPALITSSTIADRFSYTPATIIGQLQKLANLHWMVYKPYQGVSPY
jgi:Mn-dependent DtxR family transcriptional regulator